MLFAAVRPWFAVCGSRIPRVVVRGFWFMVHNSWLGIHGLRLPAKDSLFTLRVPGSTLCVLLRARWFVDQGSRFTVHISMFDDSYRELHSLKATCFLLSCSLLLCFPPAVSRISPSPLSFSHPCAFIFPSCPQILPLSLPSKELVAAVYQAAPSSFVTFLEEADLSAFMQAHPAKIKVRATIKVGCKAPQKARG